MAPQHKLGRWKIPAGQPQKQGRKRGAGSMAPKTIAAVYSTSAACTDQLLLRTRMISALFVLGPACGTLADLTPLANHPELRALNFYGPEGHMAPTVPI